MASKRTSTKKPKVALTPYITVSNAAAAIAFYKQAFGAKEITRSNVTGTELIQHAELEICGARLYLCDEFVDAGILSPLSIGGSASMLHLDVKDATSVWADALEAGAVEISSLAEVPWGGICGKLVDPFGHFWSVASACVETKDDVFSDVAPIELGIQQDQFEAAHA